MSLANAELGSVLDGGIRWYSRNTTQTMCRNNTDQGGLPIWHLALAADCKALRDEYYTTNGYFQITDWDDLDWFSLRENGTCSFSVKRADDQTGPDVWIGNEDIATYINEALDKAVGGAVAQGGGFRCRSVTEPVYEMLKWRVWRIFPAAAEGVGPGEL
ncbi:Uu.00g130980.m01.CDS01 [Anthostomella pinea]|uniref:Uu.00g130980.m01.CDS01 n=1 Tax=Anthostomella pinea TaxID=933095 RepID=A0AAI8VIR7_9PEZI|nr:Uu.00g130980.m01.CDS01 [Anthostomella pinea]